MIKILVERPENTVIVTIMYDRDCGKYRFVNLTHPHICKCKFDSVSEAMSDLNRSVLDGSVLRYKILDNNAN